MISLFLDTSTSDFIVGIYEGTKEISLNIVRSNHQLSEQFLPLIRNTLEKIGKNVDDIDKIVVVNGPGSFTGIRIGVTVAKVMAWAKMLNIITVSRLEVIASTSSRKKYICPLIDARRGYVYGALYDNNLNPLVVDKYISLEELLRELSINYDLGEIDFVSADYFEDISVSSVFPNIKKVIEKHINDKSLDPHFVNPNYLKKTEAEERLSCVREN